MSAGSSTLDSYCVPPKDSTGKKIFVFGESSVEGYLIENATRFSNQLQEKLGSKSYKVYNYGKTCKDSSFIKECFKRLISGRPESIIFYAGHNDLSNQGMVNPKKMAFLEDHPFLIRTILFLQENSRGYELFSRIYNYFRQKFFPASKITYNSLLENQNFVIDRFEEHAREIFTLAKKNNITVIVVTLAGNLNDTSPFSYYNESSKINAQLHFSLANKYAAENRYLPAFEEYEKARDFDGSGIRAYPLLNQRIKDLAKSFDNVLIVDFEKILRKRALGRTEYIGCNYFGNEKYCDFMHPNELTNRLIADAIYAEMKKNNLTT